MEGEYKGDGEIQYSDLKILRHDSQVSKGDKTISYSTSKSKWHFFKLTVVQLRKPECHTRKEELKVKMNMPKFIGSMVLLGAGGGLVSYWTFYPPMDSIIGTVALAGAVFIGAILPSLWVNEYKGLHSYDFQCEKME